MKCNVMQGNAGEAVVVVKLLLNEYLMCKLCDKM
jgi:hypothetical protein